MVNYRVTLAFGFCVLLANAQDWGGMGNGDGGMVDQGMGGGGYGTKIKFYNFISNLGGGMGEMGGGFDGMNGGDMGGGDMNGYGGGIYRFKILCINLFVKVTELVTAKWAILEVFLTAAQEINSQHNKTLIKIDQISTIALFIVRDLTYYE